MGAYISSAAVVQNPSSPEGDAGERNCFVIASPVPEDHEDLAARSRSFGSEEGVFYESQPWLESDGDNEFFSVNGDLTPSFTPSSSSTPTRRSQLATPQTLKKRQKSLSELFIESEDEDTKEEFKPTKGAPKSANSTPYVPEPEFTRGIVKSKNCKSQKSARCLLKLFSVYIPKSSKKNMSIAA